MPTKPNPIIAWSAPVSITAAAQEGEEKCPPKFTAEFYKGGAMSINGWDHPVAIDTAGLQEGNVLVANLDHDSTKRVGNFTLTNDGKSLVANGTVTAANQWADEVVKSAANGYQFQASLEVQPHASGVEFVKAGKSVEVNGQQLAGPLYVTRKGTLKGFAFVSHGADDNTTASIAANAATQKEPTKMKAEVIAWVKKMAPSLDIDSLTPEQVANFEADYAGSEAARTPTGITASAGSPFEAHKIEIQRRDEIRATADRFLQMRQFDAEWVTAVEKMYDHAIDARMTPGDFKNEMWEAVVPASSTVRAPKSRDSKLTASVLEAAICLGGNLPTEALDKHFDDKTLQAAHTRFRNGVGLKELYRLAARENGYRDDGDSVTPEMQAWAFGQANGRPIHATGGFSNLSLPGIFANTANKFLEVGWGSGEMVWADVTSVRPVRDFKQITSYRLGGAMKYIKVGPGGELEHGAVTETEYTNQANTYGRMFAITRTDIINDDLGALTQIPLELGIGGNDAFNEVFWTEFLENAGNFYHSNNGNVATGVVSSAAVLATLAAAEAAFLNQTKPNGTPLGILPNVWLVPPLAKRVAMSAMASSIVVGSTGPTPDVNTFQGNYKIVCSAYIANSAYTNFSTVKHYLICNRPGFSPIETVFLNGRSTPIVETADTAFNTLGTAMRAYHDFGVNKKEYRAVVQGSGA